MISVENPAFSLADVKFKNNIWTTNKQLQIRTKIYEKL